MEQNKESTSKEVLNKIQKGELKKHSRLYFVFKKILWISGLALIVVFSIYLGSFIVFILRATGALFLPIFGLLGLRALIFSFPWLLIIILICFVLLIEGLIKKSSFIYRNPLLYSVILIFLLVLIGSFVLERSKFHTVFFRNARENRLPVMGPVYREFGLRRIENCCIGQVLELTDNGLYMETKDEEGCNVVFSENTRFLSGKDIKVGDLVMIMGELTDGEIIAFGIRKIEDIDNFYWQQPMNHGFPKRIGPPER